MRTRRAHTFLLLRALLYLAFAALALLVLRRVAMVVAPVVTGLFLAYLLNPAVARLERRMPRGVAITLLLLMAASAFAAVVVVAPPLLSSELATFAERWGAAQARIQTVLLPWAQRTLHLSGTASVEETMQKAAAYLETALASASGSATDALGGAFRTATGVIRVIVAALLTPVFAIYFLLDFPRLGDALAELCPPRHRRRVFSLVGEINRALASWVRGQLTVMLVLGLLYAVGFALAGVPLGIAIGLLTGLMAFVPYIGVLIGLGLALAVALLDPNPASAVAGVLATYVAVQTLDAFLVTPKILGGRVGLSPVAVIFALTLGGELLGYAGVLLAVPLAAVIKVLLSHAHTGYLGSGFYTGIPDLSETDPSLTPLSMPVARRVTPVPDPLLSPTAAADVSLAAGPPATSATKSAR